MKTSSQKFADLKARREAAGLTRTFKWMTKGDQKQLEDDYKKTESYRIVKELNKSIKEEIQKLNLCKPKKIKWVETSLRRGTKNTKICRDMFISETHGKFLLCEVRNGKETRREVINQDEAMQLIETHKLIAVASIFVGCFAYRTQKSNNLLERILNDLELKSKHKTGDEK
jgi:hypothetical protein